MVITFGPDGIAVTAPHARLVGDRGVATATTNPPNDDRRFVARHWVPTHRSVLNADDGPAS
jgi:hypothetical protein